MAGIFVADHHIANFPDSIRNRDAVSLGKAFFCGNGKIGLVRFFFFEDPRDDAGDTSVQEAIDHEHT